MSQAEYSAFKALDPFFEIVQAGLRGMVDGEHFFDAFAEDAIFESRYNFPGWPTTIRGRANLMTTLSGYGKSIQVSHCDALVVHQSIGGRTAILEYAVHGKILRTGGPYDNRFISVITIENR